MDETVGLLDEVAGLLFQKKGAGGHWLRTIDRVIRQNNVKAIKILKKIHHNNITIPRIIPAYTYEEAVWAVAG